MRSLKSVAQDFWSYRPGRAERNGRGAGDLPRVIAHARTRLGAHGTLGYAAPLAGRVAGSSTSSSAGLGARSRCRGALRRRFARRWLILSLVAISIGAIVLAATTPGLGLSARAIAALDRLAVAAGLDVSEVAVVGYYHTALEDILAALELDEPKSLLAFDAAAARKRIEALDWVARARMIYVLPDALAIEVRERKPFAVWQNRGLLFLIDREGRTLEPVSPHDYKELPFIVGEGAPEAAPALLARLARHPEITQRVEAMVRVAERRWNLALKDGVEVALPEENVERALARLADLQRQNRILDRAVARIDLRIAGRVYIRPAPRTQLSSRRKRLLGPAPDTMRRRGRGKDA